MAAPRPTEIKIRSPADFDGNRTMTNEFLTDIDIYLGMNGSVYDTDTKKIYFVLSYMRGGTAGPWKEACIEEAGEAKSFGTYKAFLKKIREAFSPSDQKGEATLLMKTLQMRAGMTADEYIAQFRTAATRSGIKEDASLIDYFMDGLPIPLMEKVSMMDSAPITIEGWYTQASKYNNQYRRTKAIALRMRGGTHRDEKKKKYNFSTPRYVPKDPNAMDVDRMTIQERDEHMKKGLCFECHKPGHRASEHRDQKEPPKKYTGKEAYARIRAIMADIEGEEREEAIRAMEDEGF